MKLKSAIIALLVGLSLISMACSKSAANMSDDDKYKLFFAAMQTKDKATIDEVGKKIGLVNADGTPGPEYQKFLKGAMEWAPNNGSFVEQINTPDKAKEYVKSHMP